MLCKARQKPFHAVEHPLEQLLPVITYVIVAMSLLSVVLSLDKSTLLDML